MLLLGASDQFSLHIPSLDPSISKEPGFGRRVSYDADGRSVRLNLGKSQLHIVEKARGKLQISVGRTGSKVLVDTEGGEEEEKGENRVREGGEKGTKPYALDEPKRLASPSRGFGEVNGRGGEGEESGERIPSSTERIHQRERLARVLERAGANPLEGNTRADPSSPSLRKNQRTSEVQSPLSRALRDLSEGEGPQDAQGGPDLRGPLLPPVWDMVNPEMKEDTEYEALRSKGGRLGNPRHEDERPWGKMYVPEPSTLEYTQIDGEEDERKVTKGSNLSLGPMTSPDTPFVRKRGVRAGVDPTDKVAHPPGQIPTQSLSLPEVRVKGRGPKEDFLDSFEDRRPSPCKQLIPTKGLGEEKGAPVSGRDQSTLTNESRAHLLERSGLKGMSLASQTRQPECSVKMRDGVQAHDVEGSKAETYSISFPPLPDTLAQPLSPIMERSERTTPVETSPSLPPVNPVSSTFSSQLPSLSGPPERKGNSPSPVEVMRVGREGDKGDEKEALPESLPLNRGGERGAGIKLEELQRVILSCVERMVGERRPVMTVEEAMKITDEQTRVMKAGGVPGPEEMTAYLWACDQSKLTDGWEKRERERGRERKRKGGWLTHDSLTLMIIPWTGMYSCR